MEFAAKAIIVRAVRATTCMARRYSFAAGRPSEELLYTCQIAQMCE